METMVWPDVLDKTAHIWQAGRVARATGRLQIRGDDFSIACYEAQEYHLPDHDGSDAADEATPAQARSAGANAGNGKEQRFQRINKRPPARF